MGEAAALVASLQAEQAALARQIAEAECASAADAAQQERHQVHPSPWPAAAQSPWICSQLRHF